MSNVRGLIGAFLEDAARYYRRDDGSPTGESANLTSALADLSSVYGDRDLSAFGRFIARPGGRSSAPGGSEDTSLWAINRFESHVTFDPSPLNAGSRAFIRMGDCGIDGTPDDCPPSVAYELTPKPLPNGIAIELVPERDTLGETRWTLQALNPSAFVRRLVP